MSFLTQKAPQQHTLILNFFQNYRRLIVTRRTMNYHKRLETRNLDPKDPIREIEWFEELDKGCLVYLKDKKYPMRGLMYWDDFQAGFIWKKAITMFLRFINGHEGFRKKNIFEKLIILWAVRKQYPFYIQFLHHALYDSIYENQDKYSQPIRELYRIFPKGFELERDILCFFIESDHAYRYRFQDFVMELDKTAFKKNPLKETIRLLEIVKSREPELEHKTMWHKWNAIQKLAPFVYCYLKIFKPSILKRFIQAVGNLNIEEVKMSVEDKYWANEAQSYNFRGLKYNTRKILNI